MSGSCVIKYYNYPGVGIRNRQYLNYSQACRVGDNIECAGQGGWNPLNGSIPASIDDQIDQAFENVDLALKKAGGKGWSQVYKIRSYHVAMDNTCLVAMIRNLQKWCPNHGPLWTSLGVEKLAEAKMVVEIEAEAYDPQ
ncbi:putative L-PSP endoribonuclease family protein [Morchella snyderi]|nr:putative L-PSP endoribonuclease family protein [Morchella snyderi]